MLLDKFYAVKGLISAPSELYYICELGKYLHAIGQSLSLSNVAINSKLKYSRFWNYLRIAIHNGWLVDVPCDSNEMAITINSIPSVDNISNKLFSETARSESTEMAKKRAEDIIFDITTPKPAQFVYTNKTGDTWTWSYNGNCTDDLMLTVKNISGELLAQNLISIIAYTAVRKAVIGDVSKLNIVISDDLNSNSDPFSDLLILYDLSDAINTWVSLDFSALDENSLRNIGYSAWLHYGRETGFPAREYSPDEKRNNFSRLGFMEGDVVGVYFRKANKGSSIKPIVNFFFGVISRVTKTDIHLTLIKTKKTRYQKKKEFDEQPQAVKDMFRTKPDHYKNLVTESIRVSWYDIGIEYALYLEDVFIAPIQNDDTASIIVDGSDGLEHQFDLNGADFIYWILKDYEYRKFNEKHFLSTYFKNSVPAYIQYGDI